MEVKGMILKHFGPFIKEKHGEEAYQKWFDSLPEEAKKIYDGVIVGGAWFDFDIGFTKPLQKMIDQLYGGNLNKISELGYYTADKSLNGVFKAFISMGSTTFVVGKATYIASALFRPSKFEVIANEKGHFVLRFTEFEDAWNAFVEKMTFTWIEKAIELTGGKVDLKINTSKTKGDPYTEYEGTYQ